MCCPLHPLTLQEWAVSGPSMWGTCLFEKWNKLLKIPSFLVIWVFSSLDWTLILSSLCCWLEAKMGLSWPTVVWAAISMMLVQHFLPALALGGVAGSSFWYSFLPYLPWQLGNCSPQMCLHFLCSIFVIFSLIVQIYVYAAVQKSFSHK